jgi:hypothetical protein
LLPQRADVADLVMPSKLTGMLASGRAILATALPGTGVADAIADCGIATPPGDIEAFADALRTLASDHGLRLRLGRKAREQAEAKLARDHILLRIQTRIATLTDTFHTFTSCRPERSAAGAESKDPLPHPSIRPERSAERAEPKDPVPSIEA